MPVCYCLKIVHYKFLYQVGGSVFYSEEPNSPSPKPQTEMETLDQELNFGKEGALLETRLSSYVWICTTTTVFGNTQVS